MEEQVIIHIDGGSRGNPGLAALGVYAILPNGKTVEAKGFLGKRTNNEAEYKALIYALFLAKQQKWRNILIKCDSLLVVNQIKGLYKVKSLELLKLYDEVMYYLAGINNHFTKEDAYFDEFHIIHVPREDNKQADRLVNEALDKAEADGALDEVAFV